MTEINIIEHADGELRVSSLIIAGLGKLREFFGAPQPLLEVVS